MQVELPHAFEQGFESVLGLVLTDLSDSVASGHAPVRDELKQLAGLVHGGVYASIAESLASIATQVAVAPDGKVASGLSNQTSFMRPITEGTIHATARVRHRGRTTWVWEVEIEDDQGRLCVLTRVTVAVRDRR
ncbi:MAG TPA: hotdog fold thioesterase [Solirubrobacteraceae bacterium]|nr:hotdog fold thioesterase [Solirubrobacteraceae bacterium]